MTTQTSIPDLGPDLGDHDKRRSGDRRGDGERRRSAKGLFELRARRDRVVQDRRQSERREGRGRSWLWFWRRDS